MYKILGTVKWTTGYCLIWAQRSKQIIMSRDEDSNEDTHHIRR